MGTYIGKLEKDFLSDEEILAVGYFRVDIAVAKKMALFIGSGRLRALAGETCYIVSRKKPIILGSVHCYNLVVVGTTSPIIASSIRCRNLYAKRLIAGDVDADKIVLGEMCVVENLSRVEKAIFTDPHVYFKKLGHLGEALFAYETSD